MAVCCPPSVVASYILKETLTFSPLSRLTALFLSPLPCRRMELLDRKRRNSSPGSLNTSRLPVCSVCATATRTLTRLGTPHGSRHSGVNGFPLPLQLQMRPSLTASYRGILFFSKMALLLPRRHLTPVSTTTTPS